MGWIGRDGKGIEISQRERKGRGWEGRDEMGRDRKEGKERENSWKRMVIA